MRFPGKDEHDAYYSTYIDRVTPGAVWDELAGAPTALEALLSGLGAEEESYRYADGKWTIREVLGHILDTERVFAFRALHMARGDAAALPGMDQDVWSASSNAGTRPLSALLEEFRTLRSGNVALFRSFDEDALERRGTASGFEFTVRALVHIVAGHELHHRAILEERYLPVPESG